jgi:prevent-host-death family protein
MDVKTTLPISEARKNIFKIIGKTKRPGIYYTITDKGRPASVIMSAEEFESWQETLEVMRDFPNLNKDIEEAEKAYKSGDYKKWTTLEDLLAEEGFFIKEKCSKKHGVSAKTQTKRGKRAKKVV